MYEIYIYSQNEPLGYLYLLATLNNAAVNKSVQISL